MKTNHVNAATLEKLKEIEALAKTSAKAWELANDGSRSARSRKIQQTKHEQAQDEAEGIARLIGWTIDWPGLYPSYTDPTGRQHIDAQSAAKWGGKEREIESLQVIGVKWFDKANGNTYHNFKVIINSRDGFYGVWQYGYDDAYLQSAAEFMKDTLGIPVPEREALWRFCEQHGIKFDYSAYDTNKSVLADCSF